MDYWQAIKKKLSRSEYDIPDYRVWVWPVIMHKEWLVSCQAKAHFVAEGNILLFLTVSDRGTVFHHYISFWLHSAFPSPAHPSTHFWPLAPHLKRKLYTQHLDRTRGWRNASQGSCGAQPSCKIPWLTPQLFKAMPEHFSDIKIRCLFFPWKSFSTGMNNVVSITAGLVLDRSSRETSG